jgi:hypothetical protein
LDTPLLWHIPLSHYNEKARWALDYKRIAHHTGVIAWVALSGSALRLIALCVGSGCLRRLLSSARTNAYGSSLTNCGSV